MTDHRPARTGTGATDDGTRTVDADHADADDPTTGHDDPGAGDDAGSYRADAAGTDDAGGDDATWSADPDGDPTPTEPLDRRGTETVDADDDAADPDDTSAALTGAAVSADDDLRADTDDEQLLAPRRRVELRDRWHGLEVRFVDDPGGAVHDADALLSDAIEAIRETLDRRRTGLRDRWASVDDATTEQLRAAFHRYERTLEQLLTAPAPEGWSHTHE